MRRLATMVVFVGVAVMMAYGIGGMAVAEEEKADCADGKAIFTESKCDMCHSVKAAGIEAKVKSEKMQGPDLTGVGSRHEADWIVKYVNKEVQLNDKDHKGAFKGSDEDLQSLIAWLEGLAEE